MKSVEQSPGGGQGKSRVSILIVTSERMHRRIVGGRGRRWKVVPEASSTITCFAKNKTLALESKNHLLTNGCLVWFSRGIPTGWSRLRSALSCTAATVFSAGSLSTNQLCTPRRLRGVASAPGPLISSAVCTIVLLDVLPLRL